MKKNILFVISQFYKGGAEVSLRNLLQKIDYNLLNVDFLVMNQCCDKGNYSLLDHIPKEVNVCNAFAESQAYSVIKKLKSKFLYNDNDIEKYPRAALDFVRNKHYHFAFHVGEWWSPEFISNYVSADQKAAWIHTNIAKSINFDDELFFQFFDCFDYYIFVSKNSMDASLEKYPFLREKARVIYNITNAQEIRSMSEEAITDFNFNKEIPIVVTCANVRPEKNYSRQIEVMHKLKSRGINFRWLCIGAQADVAEKNKVTELIRKYNLESDFILLGSRENPYKYMKNATAVAVLSDYESWSMVITEAKILGVPVIATKTSGALEQIQNRHTGILTDFDSEDIADKLQELLLDKQLQTSIKNNLTDFDNTQEILQSFYGLVNSKPAQLKREILYIIDDINYNGGAHEATLRQIEYLISSGHRVDIFSTSVPNIKKRMRLSGVNFLCWRNIKEDNLFHKRLFNVLTDKNIASNQKKLKLVMTYEGRIRKNKSVYDSYVLPGMVKILDQYNTVVVMSEASAFRKQVSRCKAPKKIQWIHTDYNYWSQFNEWTKAVTKEDAEIYRAFTTIILLSETLREKFIARYPELANKTMVIKNIMPCGEILEKSNLVKHRPKLKFVTVGRLSAEKAIPRLIEVFYKLEQENYDFVFEIIGDGPEWETVRNTIERYGLVDKIILRVARTNPFTYVRNADVFLLVSEYEGLPNTIYESFIVGTPVLATRVGGIVDQITEGVNGWLVDNNIESIYSKIRYIMEHYDEVELFKSNLKSYKYDNQEVYQKLNNLFK